MKNKRDTYLYRSTKNGIQYTSLDVRDTLRQTPCVLYPDCRRNLLFDNDEMRKIDKYPFRPVVLAKMSPRYELDMHTVSGYAGYGRFAVIREDKLVWLDEFEHIETEYYNGEMRYIVQDNRISDKPINIVFISGKGFCGLIIKLDTCNLDENIDVYYLHGGMLGWRSRGYFYLEYNRDMCWGNAITINGDCAQIRLEEQEDHPNPYSLKKMETKERMEIDCSWNLLDGWKQQIVICAEDAKIYSATPDSLMTLVSGHLRTTTESWGEVVCAKLPVGRVSYASVGLDKRACTGELSKLFTDIQADNAAIAQRLIVSTGNIEFDGAVTTTAFATEGLFGDNVYLHGNLSWREGFQGWRTGYGPIAYGMNDMTAQHFENHFSKALITEGPDKGGFCAWLERSSCDGTVTYNTHQTFLHQARRFWEYTGDKAFAERLLPIVEGCIERDMRRIKPGEEMLFENCLNTWTSDHHWTVMGQCTQASAYLYNIHLLASELTDDAGKKQYYKEKAEEIKQAMNRILWQARKGIFAYAKDLKGYQMLHTEPELEDIYHPVELGVADIYQTYQMLDWAEANLCWEHADNGGTLCRNSNWHPNGGHKYNHSINEMEGGDQLNLAIAYQEIGLSEQAYDIFRSFYNTLYGGRDPEVYDFNSDITTLSGKIPRYGNIALNLPCYLSNNATTRGYNAAFADTIGMYGRAIYEGILGVRPKLQKNEIWLTPCIPEEMPHMDMQSALIDYVYDRNDTEIRLKYSMKHSKCTLYIKLYLPIAQIENVKLNGKETEYALEPGFCGVTVVTAIQNASEGLIEVSYQKSNSLPVEPRRRLTEGEVLELEYSDEYILALEDPQKLLTDVNIESGHLAARVTDLEGSGVFFLKMRIGNTEYIRPVKVWIGEKKKPEVFKNFCEEFSAPYSWQTVNMDALFNHRTPLEAAKGVVSTAERPPKEYHQENFNYYVAHACGVFATNNPLYKLDNERWRSLVDDNGLAMTGEGIPFRSSKDGNCMATATLASSAYSDRIIVPVGETGRAVYLLITGITFPMQSHVENLRILVRYEDGVEEEYPLYNPDGIGDMWFDKFERYHDTPANGFENIGGGRGALSSAGLDLTKPISTDLEAHILRFHLRKDISVKEIEMRVIANDVIFALMGITLLK